MFYLPSRNDRKQDGGMAKLHNKKNVTLSDYV